MANRKVPFVNNEFYHIYNRGVDKRNIFLDQYDIERFLQSMKMFNSIDPAGSIYEQSFHGGSTANSDKARLVNIVAYCLNVNHYHFILEQLANGGVSELMKRLGGGYTWYFNNKNDRNGALFQGRFKSVHINSNEYLLHLSSYVNLNYRVHQLGGSTAKLVRSSWNEYTSEDAKDVFCEKNIILNQFNNKKKYQIFAEGALLSILDKRNIFKDILIE